jgi:hypothetical protein
VIGVPPTALTPAPGPSPDAWAFTPWQLGVRAWWSRCGGLAAAVPLTGLLVALPVFLEAPWVRQAPFSAALFTGVLVAVGLLLAGQERPGLRRSGELLVGFSASWLAGAVFWGWARQYPICHLPIEAFALPLALGGLQGRWRLACGFYLGSLLGTAATDAAIAATGLMPLWPLALTAGAADASDLLQTAANTVFQPGPFLIVCGFGLALTQLSRWLWQRGPVAQIAATALATTIAVDALFLAVALLAPRLSGLI